MAQTCWVEVLQSEDDFPLSNHALAPLVWPVSAGHQGSMLASWQP